MSGYAVELRYARRQVAAATNPDYYLTQERDDTGRTTGQLTVTAFEDVGDTGVMPLYASHAEAARDVARLEKINPGFYRTKIVAVAF